MGDKSPKKKETKKKKAVKVAAPIAKTETFVDKSKSKPKK
jgi:hypothetical protein